MGLLGQKESINGAITSQHCINLMDSVSKTHLIDLNKINDLKYAEISINHNKNLMARDTSYMEEYLYFIIQFRGYINVNKVSKVMLLSIGDSESEKKIAIREAGAI